MKTIRSAMNWLVIPFTATLVLWMVLAGSSAKADSVTGEVQSIQNLGQCLDNSNFGWHTGNPLQMWACGAAGGVDQQFSWNGAHLMAIQPSSVTTAPPSNGWCVTSSTKGAALTIRPCAATPVDPDYVGQQMFLFDGVYEFTGNGLVVDAKGRSVANGTVVDGWNLNDGLNQQWTLPNGP